MAAEAVMSTVVDVKKDTDLVVAMVEEETSTAADAKREEDTEEAETSMAVAVRVEATAEEEMNTAVVARKDTDLAAAAADMVVESLDTDTSLTMAVKRDRTPKAVGMERATASLLALHTVAEERTVALLMTSLVRSPTQVSMLATQATATCSARC